MWWGREPTAASLQLTAEEEEKSFNEGRGSAEDAEGLIARARWVRDVEIEEGFIAHKARDGAEFLTARTPFGMTGSLGIRCWE